MSLKALRTLVTIARHGTFARAADLLSLTPSAVSLHIKTLEDELQVTLFDRSRRQVALTEAGQLAVARAETILGAYDELAGQSVPQLLASQPFLRFDKRAWAGRQIEQELRRQHLQVSEQMELDSQEALASMAVMGLGVAIIPMADDDLKRLPPATCLPLGEPQLTRRVVLLEHEKSQRRHLSAVLKTALEA